MLFRSPQHLTKAAVAEYTEKFEKLSNSMKNANVDYVLIKILSNQYKLIEKKKTTFRMLNYMKKLYNELMILVDKKNADLINKIKGRLFVVGTTSVRTLESVCKKGKVAAGKGKTEIFIKPGYKFKMKIDGMITNFHLPKSTLLMLVSAFAGRKRILDAYNIAVKEKYRFFSFGDGMLILTKKL